MTTEKVSMSEMPDPVVLGVALPWSLTYSAAMQVGTAWKSAFVALYSAAKLKLMPPKSEMPAPTEATTVSA